MTKKESGGGGASRILVDGPPGSGKSVIGLQVLDHLLLSFGRGKNDDDDDKSLVCCYFPRVSRWTAGYYPYHQSSRQSSTPNEYDQPELAIEILKLLKMLNPQFSSIEQILSDSQLEPKRAVQNFEEALRMISLFKDKKCMVVIVIDEVNALYSPTTAYRDADSKKISIDRLPVLRLLRDFITNQQHDLLAITSRSNPNLSELSPTTTRKDLNCESFQLKDSTVEQVQALLNYYKSLGHVPIPQVDYQYSQRIRFLSGGRCSKILPSVNYNFIYKKY